MAERPLRKEKYPHLGPCFRRTLHNQNPGLRQPGNTLRLLTAGHNHNEELRDLYSSPSIIRIIKSRRMRWAEHVARMGGKRNAYRLLV
jgi:hypothetical protein